MNSVPPFLDGDKEADAQAFATVPYVIPTIFSELHVFRCIFVYLTMIANQIVFFPLELIARIKLMNDPRHKYALCVFICWLITFLIPVVFRIPLEISITIILNQKFYKIWKFFTLMFIVQRFLAKVHIHTHKILRGAIWQGKSLFFPIIIHTISNFLILFAYDIYFGSYLAGLYGKPGLFISACLHIQALVAKKFLPKVLDYPPNYTLPAERLIVLFSILLHLRTEPFGKVIGLITFEYSFVLIKSFLVSISEDSKEFYEQLKFGADGAFFRFYNGEHSISGSIIVNFPIEVFSIFTLLLIVKGPFINSICILAAVLLFAFVGSAICNNVGKGIKIPLAEEKPAEEEAKKEKTESEKEKKKSE